MRRAVRLLVRLVGLAALSSLAACDEADSAASPPPVRAIKPLTLTPAATEQVRRIAGVVAAGDVAALAFERSGRIASIGVDAGDRVGAEEIVAELDREPFLLALESARSERARAEAVLADADSKFEQTSRLFERGFATRTDFDSARAALETARAALGVADAAVSQAERDLRLTALYAPFDGRVSEKRRRAFEEVAAGETVVVIQSEGEDEIELAIPETLINVVDIGDAAEVRFPTLPSAPGEAVVAEIGAQTVAGGAYPARLAIRSAPPGLRTGMTAEVAFRFTLPGGGERYLVPIGALSIDPSAAEDAAAVFRYDEAEGVVRRVEIRRLNLRDNMVEVTGPLAPGDVIAAAGVSFLSDGMEVRLFDGF